MCYLTGRLVSGLYADTSIPMTALWCPHSVIMANFMMPETHQPVIVIILIIYSVYLLKNLVELKVVLGGGVDETPISV